MLGTQRQLSKAVRVARAKEPADLNIDEDSVMLSAKLCAALYMKQLADELRDAKEDEKMEVLSRAMVVNIASAFMSAFQLGVLCERLYGEEG